MRAKRVSLLFFVVCASALVPGRLNAAGTIHPGDAMYSTVGGCTLGFAANGGSSSYFMTAAHCVEKVGEDIELEGGTIFADVAVIGDADNSATDWALLKVRTAFVPDVRGSVRGIGGTPTGSTTAGETAMGDVLRFSGHGVPFFVHAATRENRYGAVVSDNSEVYTAVGMDSWGDSGGPIVHDATGEAYGLVSRLCVGACTSEGPTIQGVLAKAAAKGFPIILKRA